ncbi:unnamed protein product [Staurois parvus]|uniref:Uncharacterized protein n=1 Tax=Staurois parvus TaxID=386267 RepID=A0ABN9DUV8_9NEOB|nr:unnamed protein product [Staurois parvus]
METSRSVRRPESGTWQSGRRQWEAVQGPMSHCGPSSSGSDQAVRGPMADLGPGSTYGRPVICQQPMTKWKPAGV